MGDSAVRGTGRAAVFLDRDGTLIHTHVEDGVPMPVRKPAEMRILPGVGGALERLRQAGFLLVLFTNQPEVARGTLRRSDVELMNTRLQQSLRLDAVTCCYHDDADACTCRKPCPGMLFDAATRLGVTLPLSFVVGDRWRDIQAGQAAGCTTILLRQPYSGGAVRPDFEASDFADAAEIILNCWETRQ